MNQQSEFRRFMLLVLIVAGVAMTPARAGHGSLTKGKITTSFCYGLKK
jgi:hypothetical protein